MGRNRIAVVAIASATAFAMAFSVARGAEPGAARPDAARPAADGVERLELPRLAAIPRPRAVPVPRLVIPDTPTWKIDRDDPIKLSPIAPASSREAKPTGDSTRSDGAAGRPRPEGVTVESSVDG